MFGRDTEIEGGEPTATERVGDSPQFSIGGFLGDNLGGSDGGSDGGNSGGNSGEFDPTIHVGRDKLNADGSFRKKRGRKSGSGASNSSGSRSRTKADIQASVDGLANILLVLHVGVAKATKTPEIEIDNDDAQSLANATANVLREFNITPDPKIAAVIGLIIAAGGVYGPMGVSIKIRKDKEARERLSPT